MIGVEGVRGEMKKVWIVGLLAICAWGASAAVLAEPAVKTAAEIKAEAAKVARENEALRKKIAELEAAAASHGDSEKEIDKNIQLIKAKLSTRKAVEEE